MKSKEKTMMSKPGILAKTHAIHLHTATGADGRIRKEYMVVVLDKEPENPQAVFAKLLSEAKSVSYFHRYSSHGLESGSHCVYHVTAVYPSREEQVEQYIYGDQSDDYNDYND